MSLPSILIGLALLLVAIPIVIMPLRTRNQTTNWSDDSNDKKPENEYESTLMAIRDLDFDYQLGMISEDDYAPLREEYLIEAAAEFENKEIEKARLEERIEEGVRMKRRQLIENKTRCLECGEFLDTQDKYCTACGTQVTNICPECDRQADSEDSFCIACGMQLLNLAG